MIDVKFLVSKLNPPCRNAVERAANLAVIEGHAEVDVEHLLIMLFENPTGDVRCVIECLNVEARGIVQDLKAAVSAKYSSVSHKTPMLSDRLIELTQAAWARSSEFQLPEIRSATLLLALGETGAAAELVQQVSKEFAKFEPKVLREHLAELFSPEEGPANTVVGGGESNPTTALSQFTIDLTAAARAGALDPVLGRDAEIRQMIYVLLRRRQNNPILTGEPGVGKTAIVEGFAIRIAAGDVPPSLRKVDIHTLDMGLLLAGASMRGEFEDRLKRLMREVQSSPKPIVLFVDEAHTLVGDRSEAADLLKPALARGELRMIAATTYVEYRKYFEKDPALARRFQMIAVDEPTEEAAVQMLRGLAPHLERHHQVRILGEAVRAAVKLSHRYVTGRQLPDKAIGILDVACARVASAQNTTPAAIDDCQHEITALEGEMDELERERASGIDVSGKLQALFEDLGVAEMKLANLEDRCKEERELVLRIIALTQKLESTGESDGAKGLRAELSSLSDALTSIQGDEPLIPAFVDARVVGEVISESTGIPLRRMLNSELHTILSLRAQLEERVFGQTHAIEIITQRILSVRAGLENPRRPAGVFLLVGPSGVGKTETAMALADILYGGERNAVVLNMSEFQERHAISGLKGSPPGYVGYGEGGVLTEAVRRRPYCLILLDEMEKAHSDVMELFYQVFDKGTLEDAQGRAIDFRNTILFMTSNAGAEAIEELCSGDYIPVPDELRSAIAPELRRVFKPALLGRMVIVPYYPLASSTLLQIIELKLDEIAERLLVTHGVELRYSPALVEEIATKCVDEHSGARDVDHAVAASLIPDISERVLYAAANRTALRRITVDLAPTGGFRYQID
ncbi:MAG: type VI secretion system ATPase TssH [Bryobacteraceae bacterium]